MTPPIQNVVFPNASLPLVRTKENISIEQEIESVSHEFVSQFALDAEDASYFKRSIEDFLFMEKAAGDLPQAMLFIRNLSKLKAITYKDGSKIIGVERLFLNAEEAQAQGDNPQGFYFEALAALSLNKIAFKIEELSVRNVSNNGKVETLRSSDGKRREIDIIAKAKFHGETVTFFIDAKSSFASMLNSDQYNGQIDALIELADRYNAIPVVLLRTKRPVISRTGELLGFTKLTTEQETRRGMVDYLRSKSQLLIWNEDSRCLVKERKLIT